MIRALLTMDDFSTRNTPAIVDYLEEKMLAEFPLGVIRDKKEEG